MTRVQLNTLELVYRPISNQEAEWVKEDKEVLDLLKESKLYMIGRRAEAFLRNMKGSDETNVVTFDFEVDGIGTDAGEFHIATTGKYIVPDEMELGPDAGPTDDASTPDAGRPHAAECRAIPAECPPLEDCFGSRCDVWRGCFHAPCTDVLISDFGRRFQCAS